MRSPKWFHYGQRGQNQERPKLCMNLHDHRPNMRSLEDTNQIVNPPPKENTNMMRWLTRQITREYGLQQAPRHSIGVPGHNVVQLVGHATGLGHVGHGAGPVEPGHHDVVQPGTGELADQRQKNPDVSLQTISPKPLFMGVNKVIRHQSSVQNLSRKCTLRAQHTRSAFEGLCSLKRSTPPASQVFLGKKTRFRLLKLWSVD